MAKKKSALGNNPLDHIGASQADPKAKRKKAQPKQKAQVAQERQPEQKVQPKKRIPVDVPEELHSDFRSYCFRRETSIGAEIRRLMRQALDSEKR